RLQSADILKQYFPQNPLGMMRPMNLNELLSQEQMRKILSGTAEERQAAIMALDPEKRTKVLAVIPDNVVEGLPDLRRERDKAREKAAQERSEEMRRLRPSLVQLLEPAQRDIAQRGTLEQRAALFASLSPETRIKVAGTLAPQNLIGLPEIRRMAMISRS